MKLAERAAYYYGEQKTNCAVALLMASSDVYELGLTSEDAKLIAGFGGGMGCGSTCGSLAGAIAALGKMYGSRSDFRDLCAGFVNAFRQTMDADSCDCSVLMPKYKTPETRCVAVVIKAAEALEAYIETI